MILKLKDAVDHIKEIRKKYCRDIFEFCDNALPLKFLQEFCRILVEENIVISWNTKINVDAAFLNKQLPALMKTAWCGTINIGVEK